MRAIFPVDPVSDPGRLFSRCLFCGGGFGRSALFGRVPPGRQLACDPRRGRLWSICQRCRRWNLIPADERLDAVDVLERAVRDTAELLAASDNIGLYAYEDLLIVRVGRAAPVERAAWRYGRELYRRAAVYRSRSTRLLAAAADGVARIGEVAGLWQLDRHWGPSRAADVLRWSRFGSVAWDGRTRCPSCSSILHTLHFDMSWWLYPRIEGGRLVVGVPCTRCDPWTPRNVFNVAGDEAHTLMRRVLAYQHVAGGADGDIRDALGLIDAAGSPDRLLHQLSTGTASLWRLGRTRTLALEMTLTTLAERRQLDGRLQGLAAEWRTEEELAGIVDDELS